MSKALSRCRQIQSVGLEGCFPPKSDYTIYSAFCCLKIPSVNKCCNLFYTHSYISVNLSTSYNHLLGSSRYLSHWI